MAYKQLPGRGNRAKTGHGIPTPFKQTPDYDLADKLENKALSSGDSKGQSMGVSYTAGRMLEGYPSQQKHVIQNVKTDKNGSGRSYETKVNAREAVQAMAVAKDSTAYLGNEKNPVIREKLGQQFHKAYSPYNKQNKKEMERTGKGYQGPEGLAGTAQSRGDLLNKLKSEGIIHGGYATATDVPEKTFGLKPAPKPTNPKTDAKKKSPMKQNQSLGKEPKSTLPQKSDKVIKEEKMAASKASFEKLKKSQEPKTPAKMKKC